MMSPDFAMREYLRWTEAASTPAGLDPVAMRGRYFLLRCSECGGAKWRKDSDGVERCQQLRTKFTKRRHKRGRYTKVCGTPRPWRSAVVLKGHVQDNSRRRSGNSQGERIAQLGLVFRVLSEQQHRAFSVYVSKGSYGVALAYCRLQWPWGGWTESVLRRLVTEARKLIEARLEKRGPYDEAERVA